MVSHQLVGKNLSSDIIFAKVSVRDIGIFYAGQLLVTGQTSVRQTPRLWTYMGTSTVQHE
jgi:hypothetical protein